MALNIPGLIAVIGFYAVFLAIGIWASKRANAKKTTGTVTEVALLGERSINLVVGIFTMTASWVGGAYILGIAETVYDPKKGLIWAQMPLQDSFSFIVGASIFAKPMRERKYVTVIDPFEIKYGKTMAVLISIPALIGELLCVTCSLTSLGGMMSAMLELQQVYSVVISTSVAVTYTLLGGLYSVAYTDVFQLIFIFIGLGVCVPFIFLNPLSLDISSTAFNSTYQPPWIGQLQTKDIPEMLDDWLTLGLGALAMQSYQQRNLSSASAVKAQIAGFAAAFLVVVLAVPSILIGAVAASTDWNQTDYGYPPPYERDESHAILPICLKYLSPFYVSIFGIGALTAASMSSVDAFLLSFSSMFTTNLYKNLIRKQASDKELQWVIRISLVVAGVLGASLTSIDNSIVVFLILSSDLAYCIVLPQFICVLFLDKISNSYGAVIGFVFSILLRLLSGEPFLDFPPVIRYPGGEVVDGVYIQPVPVRTVTAIFAFCCILFFSYTIGLLFRREVLPKRWDVFGITKVTVLTSDNQNAVLTPLTNGHEQMSMSPVMEMDSKEVRDRGRRGSVG